jgi:hypothetical protein
MKNNTNELKSFLKKALVNTPDDFSLTEVKSLIVRALDVVEQVENKREKRQSSVEARKTQNVYVTEPQFAWKAIESELANEKAKLEEIKKRKSMPTKPNAISSEEEEQNVFG